MNLMTVNLRHNFSCLHCNSPTDDAYWHMAADSVCMLFSFYLRVFSDLTFPSSVPGT